MRMPSLLMEQAGYRRTDLPDMPFASCSNPRRCRIRSVSTGAASGAQGRWEARDPLASCIAGAGVPRPDGPWSGRISLAIGLDWKCLAGVV